MDYEITIQSDKKIILIETFGKASFSGFKSYINALLKPPYIDLEYHLLTDHRNLDFSSFTNLDVQMLVNYIVSNKTTERTLKNAIVVSQPLSFGLARMFELLIDEFRSIRTEVFYTYEDAETWILGGRDV